MRVLFRQRLASETRSICKGIDRVEKTNPIRCQSCGGETVTSQNTGRIVVADTVFLKSRVGISGNHLPQVERLCRVKVVNAVRTAEVGGENIQWQQVPGIHDLRLVEAAVNVAVIVHPGRQNLNTPAANHVRENPDYCNRRQDRVNQLRNGNGCPTGQPGNPFNI